jgi:uncharacterized protein YqgQ
VSISERLQELDELYRNGTLLREEYEAARRRVLEEPGAFAGAQQLEEIRIQNEIAQLDREWLLERENYMLPTRYGHRRVPGKTGSVLGGIVAVGFGILWTGMASSMAAIGGGPFNFFPFVGVLFILFGAGMSVVGFMKSVQHDEAQRRYQRRRAEIQNRARVS